MTQGHGDDAYRYPRIAHNFSTNVSPRPDLAALKEHLSRSMHLLDSYPEPDCRRLAGLIADRHGLPAESVIVTAGATEAIYLVAQWLGRRPCASYTLACSTTFSEYEDACRMFGLGRDDHGNSPMAQSSVDTPGLDTCWLCNPNNPTGSVVSPEEVLRMAAHCRVLVVDQSYEDYTLAPMLTPAEAVGAGNIVQLHSMTKTFAVPGLRLGWMVAAPPLAAQLRMLLRPWSVNALAVEAGCWLLNHAADGVPRLPALLSEAQRLRSCLSELPGVAVLPTSTHFMLGTVASVTAGELKERLALRYGILIRDASNFSGLSPHHFRVSALSRHADDLLVEAISELLSTTPVM